MDRYEPVTKALPGHAGWNEEDLTPLAQRDSSSGSYWLSPSVRAALWYSTPLATRSRCLTGEDGSDVRSGV